MSNSRQRGTPLIPEPFGSIVGLIIGVYILFTTIYLDYIMRFILGAIGVVFVVLGVYGLYKYWRARSV
jgi:hypothetical protein